MGPGGILSYIRILLIFICISFPTDCGSLALSSDEAGNELPDNATPNPVNCNLTESPSAMIAAPTTPTPREDGLIRATLPFSMMHLGMIECEGADNATDFLEEIFGNGINFNKPDYLCGPTCRGKCIPRPRDVGLPPSIYPFGCSCESQGCDANGPIIAPLIKPTFKIVCRQDPHCTCVAMEPGQFTGYSCNWINTKSQLPVTFKHESLSALPGSTGRPPVKLPQQFFSRFFPVRWCSCCPRVPIMRSGE